VNRHRLRLPDAVHAVHRLRLYGGVPPRVEQKRVVRRSKVQTNAAGCSGNRPKGANGNEMMKRAKMI
jgi:hypothetical protein